MANLATPVNITSITNVGKVVTVTTQTAHGLAINQGFSIENVTPVSNLDINSTVVNVPSSTSITFTLANPGTYTSGGTLGPATESVILSTSVPQIGLATLRYVPGNVGITVTYLHWLTTSNPSPIANLTSAWDGASPQQIAALQAGTTIEIVRSFTFSNTATKAQIQAAIAADYATQQANLAASIQPGQYLGQYFDGTGWSA